MVKFLVLTVLFALSAATQVSYDGYEVVTIKVNDPRKLDLLFTWQDQGIDFWDSMNALGHPVRVMIPPFLREEFSTFLKDNDIPYEPCISNVETVFQAERKIQVERRARALLNRMAGRREADWSYYWRTGEIHTYLHDLAAQYPNLVTLSQAGTSYEGTPIWSIKISSTNDGTKPVVFGDATIHAREWIAPMACLYLIHQLVVNSADNADLLDVDWVLIPLANPDGYEFSHTNNRMWRKTRSINPGSTCIGVDGNRNYRVNWGYSGISTNPCSDIYLGPAPHSEVEVQAVSNELTKYADRVKLYLSFHSFGDYFIYPWGHDRIPHPNNQQLDHVGERASDAMYYFNGRRYTVGNSAILLYPAAGASDDYAAGEHGIDLSYTIELTGGGNTGFDLPASQIHPVSSHLFIGLSEMARYIAENY